MPTGFRPVSLHAKQLILLMVWGAISLALAGIAAAAGPVYWDMPASLPFTQCRLDGVRITSEGFLAPGLARDSGLTVDASVVWSVAPDGQGGYFLGTGHEGRILRVNSGGELSPWADLDCDEVLSLLPLPSGGVVAGCEPDGQVYLLDTEAHATKVGEVTGGYIWSLVRDDKGLVYIATGNPAGVSLLDPVAGTLREILSLPAENALALAFDRTGKLFVTTQGPGLVYRVDLAAPGGMDVILQTSQDEVTDLVRGPEGKLYALALGSDTSAQGTVPSPPTGEKRPGPHRPVVMVPGPSRVGKSAAPQTALYDLAAEDGPQEIWSGDLDLLSVTYVEGWGWLGGGLRGEEHAQSVLFHLISPGSVEMLTSWQGGDILGLQSGMSPGELVVVQANPSRIDFFRPGKGVTPEVQGPILDAGRQVTWGRLFWSGEAEKGGLRWSVRTGNREVADETWSDWSSSWSTTDHPLAVPRSRFLQWRATFSPSKLRTSDQLMQVTVSAWGENRPPIITKFKPEELKSVRGGGLMVQRDNLTRTFKSGLKAEFNRGDAPRRPHPAERAEFGNSVAIFSWQGTDPDQDRLHYEFSCRKQGTETWIKIDAGDDSGLEAWDTTEVPDGIYDVRLRLDDTPDNPRPRNRESEKVFGPVLVDNTPPVLGKLSSSLTRGILRLKFIAEDANSPLAAAFLVLPAGDRLRLDPKDQICDSLKETFSVTQELPAQEDAPLWLRVEVLDTAGNLTTQKILTKVE